MTKQQFIERMSAGFYVPRLANYKYAQHFNREETYYFHGNPRSTATYTLAMIDVDVQKKLKKGSAEGAVAFAEHLRTYWPGLCYERSNGGKGLGCPIFMRKDGRSAKEVNAALKRLDAWLKAEAAKVGADIENVEVKGHLPVITYNSFRLPTAIQFGQFARYPRTLTFEQLQNSPVLSVEDLLLAQMPKAEVREKAVAGSVSGHCLTDEELSMVGHYAKLYKRLTEKPLKATARFVVTDEDFGIACVLLRFFKRKPNKDDTLPTRRVEAIWTELYKQGLVSRPWNHHRWARIRDFLSERGYIDWIDNRYQFGLHPRACKWRITDEFDELLEDVAINSTNSDRESIFVDTALMERGTGQNLRPQLALMCEEHEQEYWSGAEKRLEMLFAA